jgi:hypothetical protein
MGGGYSSLAALRMPYAALQLLVLPQKRLHSLHRQLSDYS